MKKIFERMKDFLLKNWWRILAIICIFTLLQRFELVEKRSGNFVSIPFRYFNFTHYPSTHIDGYFYENSPESESLRLNRRSYGHSIDASIVVKKDLLTVGEKDLLSGREMALAGKRGNFSFTKTVEGGSRSMPVEYFTYNFIFSENGYYYIATVSSENEKFLDKILKELVEDIRPI